MMNTIFIFYLLISIFQQSSRIKEIFGKEELEIHVIPHSHCDLGWVQTIDQYFNGFGTNIDRLNVNQTLTSVMESLNKNTNRTFIFAEIGFFRMWWQNTTKEYQEIARKLIKNKQFQFVNGGISQNDEATTYYEDIIDQLSWGHQFIIKHFGKEALPKIGWQIDPFGHSQTQINIFNQMGYEGWFFARTAHLDMQNRKKNKNLEFLNQASNGQYIFSHLLYNHYSAPKDFCFDSKCIYKNITNNSVKTRSNELMKYFISQQGYYNQNIIMHLFGDDFNYQQAENYYINLEKLMECINKNYKQFKTKIFFSTPQNYLDSIKQLNKSYTIKKDDFFPYSDNQTSIWTGYFTSRPNFKLFVKQSGRFLQKSRNLFSILQYQNQLNDSQRYFKDLDQLEYDQGLMQHHDAVSGTASQLATNDYFRILYKSVSQVQQNLFQILDDYNQKQDMKVDKYQICNWNVSYHKCFPVLENENMKRDILINIYNPGPEVLQVVRIKVSNSGYQLQTLDNEVIPIDIICIKDDDCDLYFQVKLEQLKIHNYILKMSVTQRNLVKKQELKNIKYNINSNFGLKFQLFSKKGQNFVTVFRNQTIQKFQIRYGQYKSYAEHNKEQKAGAYVFRIENNSNNFWKIKNYPKDEYLKKCSIFIGKIVTIVHLDQLFLSTQVKFYNDVKQSLGDAVEIETYISGIDVSDRKGKDYIILIDTDIKNNDTFITDSNGLQFQERKLDYRQSYEFKPDQIVPENYYPVNGIIGIEDANKSFFILNDRSQGGSSLKEGEIELMIHRRLLYDDGKGLGERLNEELYPMQGIDVTTQHYLLFGNRQDGRNLQYTLDQSPIVVLSNFKEKNYQISQKEVYIFQPMFPIKKNLKFYLKYLEGNDFMLRFHNFNEKENIKLDIDNLNITETTIVGSKTQKEAFQEQYQWNQNQSNLTQNIVKPMQFKTFLFSKS